MKDPDLAMAIQNALNSEHTAKLSDELKVDFMESMACIALDYIIRTKGVKVATGFCNEALSGKAPLQTTKHSTLH